MNSVLIQLFSSILVFIVILFAILNNSIKDMKFVCNKYLLNTYLYILLTLNIIAIFVLSIEYSKINFDISLPIFFCVALLSIICIILLHYIPATQLILKHIIWLVLVLSIGTTFYPMYNSYRNNKGAILSAILTTMALFLILSGIAYWKPNWISLSWGPVLFFLLLAGIVGEVIMLFFYKTQITKTEKSNSRWFTYFFILLFMAYILYDTKRLQINAKECVDPNADYIKESLGLFLDIFNIFVRILSLSDK